VRVVGDTLVPIADSWTTRLGTMEERGVKWLEHLVQRGWRAPWIEVHATRRPCAAGEPQAAPPPSLGAAPSTHFP